MHAGASNAYQYFKFPAKYCNKYYATAFFDTHTYLHLAGRIFRGWNIRLIITACLLGFYWGFAGPCER